MKVSCVYWFVLLSALAVNVCAEDAPKSKSDGVEEKWFGGGFGAWGVAGLRSFNGFSFYNTGYINRYSYLNSYLPFPSTNLFGCAILPYYSYPLWFSKATDTAEKAKSRRSSVPTIEHINRRGTTSGVGCRNRAGQREVFQKTECQLAAAKLVEAKSASATHGGCTLSLVGPQGIMAAKNVPTNVIQKAVEDILTSCEKDQSAPHAKRSPAELSKTKGDEIALVISKSH